MTSLSRAAPISLFWTPKGLNELYRKCVLNFHFNLIGKSTMAFLTGQSWRILKSWYRGGSLEKGFRRCFADVLNKSLVLSVAPATLICAEINVTLRFLIRFHEFPRKTLSYDKRYYFSFKIVSSFFIGINSPAYCSLPAVVYLIWKM